MRRYLYILLLLLADAWMAYGQKFTATASQTEVGLNDVFQMDWSLEGSGNGFSPSPSLSEFDILSGPNQSSSISIINGRVSQSIGFSYMLRPKKTGTFKIAPASIRSGNATVQSNTLTIKVVQGTAKATQRGSQGNGGDDAGNPNAEYFIRVSVDKANVLEGEPVTATYKLYLRNASVEQYAPRKAPSFTGFWVKDLPDAIEQNLHSETVDGKGYQVAVIKKSILYPQHPGTLTVDAMEADAVVAMRAPRRQHSFFDDPFADFFDQVETYRRSLKSNSVPVKVNPLPEAGKPANFSGLVGNFRIRANVDRTSVRENDAITYRLTVEGQGNLQQVQPLTLNLPPDWDVYDPKTVEKPGAKIFEYTIIPKNMGKYTLPAVEFSYFNLATRRYQTDKTQEFNIEVLKGNGSSKTPSVAYNKEDVKLLGQDIRFIKTASGGLTKDENTFYGSAPFWALSISPFMLFGLMVYFRRKNEEALADVAGTRKRKATGMARKRLKTAQTLMQKGDTQNFYTEVLLALYGYIQNKIGLQLAETSRDTIRQVLTEHHARQEETDRFLKIVDTCEFAKYAPSAASGNLQEVYNESVDLITNLEGQLK